MAKKINVTLTPEELKNKIATLKANIEKLNAKGMEDMAAEFQVELDNLMELETKSQGTNRAEEFAKLFPSIVCYNLIVTPGEDDSVGELTEEQLKWLGEKGVSLNLDCEGKLTFVKAAGGNTGGTKSETPYLEYHIPYTNEDGTTGYEVFTKAAAAAGLVKGGLDAKGMPKVTGSEPPHIHSVERLLRNNGNVVEVAEGDSMRRWIVAQNKKFKLGIKVKLRSDDSVINLIDSDLETESKETPETTTPTPNVTGAAEMLS